MDPGAWGGPGWVQGPCGWAGVGSGAWVGSRGPGQIQGFRVDLGLGADPGAWGGSRGLGWVQGPGVGPAAWAGSRGPCWVQGPGVGPGAQGGSRIPEAQGGFRGPGTDLTKTSWTAKRVISSEKYFL